MFCIQLAFYILAALGSLFPSRFGRLGMFYIPAYFCAINAGALLGLWGFLTGQRYAAWQPRGA